MTAQADDDTLALSDPQAGAPTIPPGGRVGRFVILGPLGAGGMGLVVAAYDPELDRKVAIKLLRADAWGGAVSEGRARLAREAQAMARLSHPNVVAVYEVGSVGDSSFVVMELIEGQTLKSWLAETRRDWREVRAMFLAAGRGLSAAHQAGLVHRDFKPPNVLVGRDGRARITDFGLVSVHARSSRPAGADSSNTGLVGTPAYMAPEQLDDALQATVDARADQFGFCVALYEALYGERPFAGAGAGMRQMREAMQTPPRLPPRRDVPAWLGAIVLRGLERDPARRWPDMSALLDALAHDPQVARRTLAVRIAVGALVLIGGVALWRVEHGRRVQCDHAGARLAGIWDRDARARLRTAFTGSGSLSATVALAQVTSALDQYTHGWTAMSEEACRANRVDARQSDTLYDLRMACLESRRQQLHALVSQWSSGMSKPAVEEAGRAVSELPPVDECADAAALTAVAPLPRDATTRAQIAAVRAELDRSRAFDAVVEYQPALAAAEHANQAASKVAWPEVQAEAQLQLGIVGARNEDPKTRARLQAATRLATLAHDDNLAARAFVEEVREMPALPQGGGEMILALADAAEAFVARAGDNAILRGRISLARGVAFSHLSRYAEAEEALLHARALLQPEGPLHDDNVRVLNWLTDIDMMWGHLDDAEKWGELALATQIAASGPDHPRLSDTLVDLADVYAERNELDRARDNFKKAVILDERNFGPDSTHSAGIFGNLCQLTLFAGGPMVEAEGYCRRALAIAARQHDDDGMDLRTLTDVLLAEGRVEAAEATAKRAMAEAIKANGKPSVSALFAQAAVARAYHDYEGARAALERVLPLVDKPGIIRFEVQRMIADVLREAGKYGEAEAAYRALLPGVESIRGRDHVDVARALAGLGRALVSDGNAREALPLITRALATFVAHHGTPEELGETRFALARAELLTGNTSAARADAVRAEADLTTAEPADAKQALSELRLWRAHH